MKHLNFKSLLLIIVLSTVYAGSSAQNREYPRGGQYLTNGLWDNWFISVGAGDQVYWGNSNGGVNEFFRRSTMTYNMSLGKWITPTVGFRVQGNVTQKAQSFICGVDMNMFSVHGDVMFNLPNLFAKYREARTYQPVVFLGTGYAQNRILDGSTGKQHALIVSVGLINKFRVSRSVDLNLELAGLIAPRSFDSFIRSSKSDAQNIRADISLQASIGVTYRFGAKGFERPISVVEVDLTPYNNKISGLQDDIAIANTKAAELNAKIADLELIRQELENRKPETKIVNDGSDIKMPPISAFYNLGSSTLGPKELVILEDVSKIIKQTPTIKYKITGLIDYSTGSAALNEKLCDARIQSAYKALIGFGVKAEQLVRMEGSPASPSKNPILNRGVVVAPIL